jgi:hypothetical protein
VDIYPVSQAGRGKITFTMSGDGMASLGLPTEDHKLSLTQRPGPVVATYTEIYRGPQVAWTENGANLIVDLPQVHIHSVSGDNAPRAYSVYSELYIPQVSTYRWGLSGQIASVTRSLLKLDQSVHLVNNEYNGFESDNTAPTLFSVNDPSAIADDSRDLFVAGAMVGVAGAAFIAMVDSAMRLVSLKGGRGSGHLRRRAEG